MFLSQIILDPVCSWNSLSQNLMCAAVGAPPRWLATDTDIRTHMGLYGEIEKTEGRQLLMTDLHMLLDKYNVL